MSVAELYDLDHLENSIKPIYARERYKIAKYFIKNWNEHQKEITENLINYLNSYNTYVKMIPIWFFKEISLRDESQLNFAIEFFKAASNDWSIKVKTGIRNSLKHLWKTYPEKMKNLLKSTDIFENSSFKILLMRGLDDFLNELKNKKTKDDFKDYDHYVNLLLEEIDSNITFNETFFNSNLSALIYYSFYTYEEKIVPYFEKWAKLDYTIAHYLLKKSIHYSYKKRKELKNFIEESNLNIIKNQLPLLMNRKFRVDYIEREFPTIIEYFNMGFYPFYYSLNPYRGSEYEYFYSNFRFNHNYYGKDIDSFHKIITVKTNAQKALERDLSIPLWRKVKTNIINVGSICDAYQKAEAKYELTKSCLEVLLKYENPICISTISPLILRDIDILRQFAEKKLLNVMIQIPTMDENLKNSLEINTPSIKERLDLIKQLKENNIITGALFYPILPDINDNIEEIENTLKTLSNIGLDFVIPHTINFRYNIKHKFTYFLEKKYSEELVKKYDKLYPNETRDGNIKKSGYKKLMKSINKLLKSYKLTPKKQILEGKYKIKETQIPRIEIRKIKCQTCGTKIDFDAKFCPNCGMKF